MAGGADHGAVIRPADARRDDAACAAIYAPYVETAITFELDAPDAAEFAGRIERFSASHAWLVAEIGGEVAGYAYASPHAERAAYAPSCNVGIYCAAACQGRGLGLALYGALLPLLAERGFHAAFAGITLPNAASIALHERAGFALAGVFREVGRKNGAWHDVGWWQKVL